MSMANSWKEFNADLGFTARLGENTTSQENGFIYDNPIDNNNDNFTDVTQQKRFSVFQNSRQPNTEKSGSLALRYLY